MRGNIVSTKQTGVKADESRMCQVMTVETSDGRRFCDYYVDEQGELVLIGKQGELRFFCFICQIFGHLRDCPIGK